MDTTSNTAVSRMGRIRAEEQATALQRLEEQKDAKRAVMAMYLLVECEAIVSHSRTFVNEENTTDSSVVFFVFLYTMHKRMQKYDFLPYSPSMTALQTPRTLLRMGTQVWLP